MPTIVYDNTQGRSVTQILSEKCEELRESAIVLKYSPDLGISINLINTFDIPEFVIIREKSPKKIYTESINNDGDNLLCKITRDIFGDYVERSYEEYALYKQRCLMIEFIEKKTSEFVKTIKKQFKASDPRLEDEAKRMTVSIISRKLIG